MALLCLRHSRRALTEAALIKHVGYQAVLSGIDINFHVDESFEGRSAPLKFKSNPAHVKEAYCRAETYYYKTSKDNITPCDVYGNTALYDKLDNIVLMTEIQLKNIVDRLGKESTTGTDGDEFTIKEGIKVSKFSKRSHGN